MFLLLFAIVGFGFLLQLRYRGRIKVPRPVQECDSGLWTHVYERGRLQVVEPCAAVKGRVRSVHKAEDGDLHIALEPEDVSVLNLVNVIHNHGTLVVEVACEHTPVDAVAKAACGDYRSQILIPQPGDEILVTGAYVSDRDNGWREMHPVSRIQPLP